LAWLPSGKVNVSGENEARNANMLSTNSAPSVGPVIAASLNASLGWRSIFWCLAICAGVWLLVIAVSLPETLRALVGNGSAPISPWRTVPLPCMRTKSTTLGQVAPRAKRARPALLSLISNLASVLCEKDKSLVMIAIAILYMVWNCLQASLSTIFIKLYHFSNLQAGLIYIPFGVGVGCAGFVTGELNAASTSTSEY
jgi:MFS family permease